MPSKAKSKAKATYAPKKQKPNPKSKEGMLLRSALIEDNDPRLSNHSQPPRGVSKAKKKAPANKPSNITPSKAGLILRNSPQRSPLKAERTIQVMDSFESDQEKVKREHSSPQEKLTIPRRSKMYIGEVDLHSSESNVETSNNELTHYTSNPAKNITARSPQIKLNHQEFPRQRSMEEDIAERLRDLRFVSFKELRLGWNKELIFAAYFEEIESKQQCVVDFTSEELVLLGTALGTDVRFDFLELYLMEHATSL